MCSQPRNFHLGFHGLLGLALTFLSGCNADLAEVCSGKYDCTVTNAIAQIEPLSRSAKSQRSIASRKQELATQMSEDEREHWQSWSEKELKRVEAYLDWANLHREESSKSEKARRRLTDAANRLIAFHGYSQEGRVERMLDVLRALESDRKEIQEAVCQGR